MIFDKKFVFHIPLYRFTDELVPIEIEYILDELVGELESNGFDSMYFTNIKSRYKKREFEEMLITLFANNDLPSGIFEKWFRKNNDVLSQVAFAYEYGNIMVVIPLNSE